MTDSTDQLRRAIEEAGTQIDMAYWSACDAIKAAIDPSEVTAEEWAIDLLAEAYDVALRIQGDPGGWDEGRAKW